MIVVTKEIELTTTVNEVRSYAQHCIANDIPLFKGCWILSHNNHVPYIRNHGRTDHKLYIDEDNQHLSRKMLPYFDCDNPLDKDNKHRAFYILQLPEWWNNKQNQVIQNNIND